MSKSNLFWLIFAILLVCGIGLYSYQYFIHKAQIEKADALFQEEKFDEALLIYQTNSKDFLGIYNYEYWSGAFDIERIQKTVLPTFQRATNALQNPSPDSLLVALTNLKSLDMKYAGYRKEPISINQRIEKQTKIAYNKIIALAQQSEQENPALAIKLYDIFQYDEEGYKGYQTKIKGLYKDAFFQKYNEKAYMQALPFYNKMEIADKTRYQNELKEPVSHSSLEVAKKYKALALSVYMEGDMSSLEDVTSLLLQVDSTSKYYTEAKTELENLNQEVAYKMGIEEYKAGNLDESLHFFAQIPSTSVNYKDASEKITEISQKLEKENKDVALVKKRTEAYAEIKKQLSVYLNDKSSYSVILSEAEEANKKFKYTIVYQDKSVPTSKKTDFLSVTDSTFQFFLDDVGMEILSNKGQQITQAGYTNYVGNSEYGNWKQNDEGSFWEFYGKYALLSTLFSSNRIYRDDYTTYNRYYKTSSRPYYGSVYVPLKSAVKQTPRFEQTVANRSQKSWFYAKSVPSRSSTKTTSTASTSNKSWYYGRQPANRNSYTSTSTASNRNTFGRSTSTASRSNSGYRSSSSSSSSSGGYKSSSNNRSSSSSSRTTRSSSSSSSSSRSRSSSSRGGK